MTDIQGNNTTESIDLRKIFGIQFDPEAIDLSSGVVDGLDYDQGIVNHRGDHLTVSKEDGTATFVTNLLAGSIAEGWGLIHLPSGLSH